VPDGTTYDEDYYRANGQDRDRPALRLYQRLVRRYLRPTRVLDVGCGTGHLLARLARDAPADGLEVSEYSAATARTRSPRSTVYADAADLPSGAFDAFTAVHVLEHVPDAELGVMLRELHRAVAPGGRGLVVVPDPAGRGRALHGEAWLGFTDPTHVNLKPHAAWVEALGAHGFPVVRAASDGLWNFPYSRLPVPLDALRHGLPMAAQFLAGRLLLAPGSGESSLLLVRRDDTTR
jgi:SAM-dependent methyltransferase